MRLANRAVVELRGDRNLMDGVKERTERIVRDAWFQAAVALMAAAIAESLLGIGGAARILYLVPAWYLAERRYTGIAVVTVLTGILLHALFGSGSESNPWIGAILQAAFGLTLVFRIDRHVRHTAMFVYLAGHDPLTGVANRKTLEAYADRELNRCVAEGRPFTVAVIDCDKFKALNDVYGHTYGDEVLRQLAANVEKAIGKRGKLGRMGGDEFVVVLPGMSFLDAEARLSHAAKAFEDATLIRGGKASFSVGLAECPTDGVFFPRLLDAADDDMYRRKAAKKQSDPLFEITA